MFVFVFFGVNESCGVRKELDKSQVFIVTKYKPSFAVETPTNTMDGTTEDHECIRELNIFGL